MKIGIFSDSYRPYVSGVVLSIETFSRELARLGHEIFIFAPDYPQVKGKEFNIFRFPSFHTPFNPEFYIALPISMIARDYASSIDLDLIHVHSPFTLGQEEERRRLAREIHDSPAQAMANIVLRAEYCEQLLVHDPAQLSSELEKLKCTVRRTLTDIRKIIFDLRPMVLDDLGLAGGVRRLCEVFRERDKLAVDFLLYGSERRYSRILEVAVFRIIQEALNNVQKHAEASRATVKLELRAERVFAAIQDDGIGFDPEVAAEERERYGLTNMRERAQALQGELQVSSTKGEGTTITVVIPVGEEVLRYGEDKSSHR
jgi:signal transduction histidine kinase